MPSVPLSELSTSWARYLRSERKSDRTVRLYGDAVTYVSGLGRCASKSPDLVGMSRREMRTPEP